MKGTREGLAVCAIAPQLVRDASAGATGRDPDCYCHQKRARRSEASSHASNGWPSPARVEPYSSKHAFNSRGLVTMPDNRMISWFEFSSSTRMSSCAFPRAAVSFSALGSRPSSARCQLILELLSRPECPRPTGLRSRAPELRRGSLRDRQVA